LADFQLKNEPVFLFLGFFNGPAVPISDPFAFFTSNTLPADSVPTTGARLCLHLGGPVALDEG
jgi:hypothetical protein